MRAASGEAARAAGARATRPSRLTLALPLAARGARGSPPSRAAGATTGAHAAEELRRRADLALAAAPPHSPAEPPPFALNGALPSSRPASPVFDEPAVDFANAALYITGIQCVFAICCCASVSVLACSVVPSGNVSAVRTLVFCVLTAVGLMRRPLRVGRARGVSTVFTALQPAVAVYLLCLVVEQLLHTCTGELGYAPSWRRALFHAMIAVMITAGFMRARAPMEETDMPFLLTCGALALIALAPPPALAFTGPLCQSVDLWSAADRVVRAFVFSSLYCIHVFVSTPSSTAAASETIIVVTRSTASALWTMGAHPVLLPIAVAQATVGILARLRIEQRKQADSQQPPPPRGIASACSSALTAVRGALGSGPASNDYAPVGSHPPPPGGEADSDVELGGVYSEEMSPQAAAVAAHHAAQQAACAPPLAPPLAPHQQPHQQRLYEPPEPALAVEAYEPPPPASPPEERAVEPAPGAASLGGIGPLPFREIGGPGPQAPSAEPMTAERMAQIAASIPD